MPDAPVSTALGAKLAVEEGSSILPGRFQRTGISDARLSRQLLTPWFSKCKMLTGGRCLDVSFNEEFLLRGGRFARHQGFPKK